MCIECGKSNVTKVEVDKHLIFYTMKNHSSCEQCGKAFTQNFFFVSIKDLLLGKSHTCQYCEETITRSPALRMHAQKAHNMISRNGS